MFAGEYLKIGSVVQPGEPVPWASVLGYSVVKGALGVPGCTLEEHVLNPMGNPSKAWHLISGADLVPDEKRCHRSVVGFMGDDP